MGFRCAAQALRHEFALAGSAIVPRTGMRTSRFTHYARSAAHGENLEAIVRQTAIWLGTWNSDLDFAIVSLQDCRAGDSNT